MARVYGSDERYHDPMYGRLILTIAAVVLSLVAVLSDFLIGGWWERHPMLASFVGGLATLVLTALVIDRVIARRERRQREPVHGLIEVEIRLAYEGALKFVSDATPPSPAEAFGGGSGHGDREWLEYAKQATALGRALADTVVRWSSFVSLGGSEPPATKLVSAAQVADELLKSASSANLASLESLYGASNPAESEPYLVAHLSACESSFRRAKNLLEREADHLSMSYRYLMEH